MTHKAFDIEGEGRQSRWLITVDHATNLVPPELPPTLGLPPEDMARHIAWDPGALGVARALGHLLDAPVVSSRFSRLVIDPNRGATDPTVLMKLYDGSVIPGNRHADAEEKRRRISTYHEEYHGAVAGLAARRADTVLVSVHSFTPQLRGRAPRPWHIGILHAHDSRLSDPLIAALKAEADLSVGRNEPYPGHLPGDSMDRHALQTGRHNTLIELRNDLIATDQQQQFWAEKLAPKLEFALSQVHDQNIV